VEVMIMNKIVRFGILALGYSAFVIGAQLVHAADNAPSLNTIEKIDFATLPGEKLNVKVTLSEPMTNPPAGFTLSNPSRIALDFPSTANGLSKNMLAINQGVLRSVSLAQAKGRTRMVLNLTRASAYTTRANGKEIDIELQPSDKIAGVGGETVTKFAEPKLGETRHSLSNVDFARGKNGEGRIIVDLSDNTTGIDIRQQGAKILVDFLATDIPENLQRRLNVTDFATPVLYVDAVQHGKNVRMTIEPKGLWEHSAYQADRKFIIDVRPLVEDPSKLVQGSRQGYKGEKLSLNFQNIEVRSVLQVIADFTGFNIITSDSVSGNITLRLKDVPWDQALDIIMQARGLGMRKDGNVILIAPAEELAAKEKQRLEAQRQIEDLEPLRTETFTLKYHQADAFKTILTDPKQKILSSRGSAVIDPRTNTLFVQDTEKNLEKVERILKVVDVPIRQVLIESRIVLADDGFAKSLGAKFGITKQAGRFGVSGSQSTAVDAAKGTISEDSLITNLPASGDGLGTIGLSFFKESMNLLLSMELSASEADNKTKTISSPKVITGNQQKAIIESGVEIPYQEASSSGATSTSFKKATLGMEVTPQITPDNKINMELLIKKDAVANFNVNGTPALNTNRVETKVLVDNGETAVLGGIFEETTSKTVNKVPFFGDLPVFGRLFKQNIDTIDKNELLIFITPKLLDDTLKAN
jgi:type IV pilus assembly protein PilQ